MSYTKIAPGKYQVWIGDMFLNFKTERDADRFIRAMERAAYKSWEPTA